MTNDFITDAEMDALSSGVAPQPSSEPEYLSDAEMDALSAEEQPPGIGRSLLQGIAQTPGGVARMGETFLDYALPQRAVVRAVGGTPEPMSRIVSEGIDEKMEQPFIAATGRGFVEPQTTEEGYAAAAGRGLGGFATMPLGGIGGVISSLMGAVAGEAAKNAGLPWYGQMLAGIVGSASPSVAGIVAPRVPGVAAVTGRVGRAMSPQMRRDAVNLGAANTLRGNVGNVSRAAQALDDEARGLGGPGLASTAQALRTEAPGLVGLEGGLARTSTAGFGERLAARRESSARQIDEAYNVALRGNPGAVRGSFTARLADSRANYRRLYGEIDDASVGAVPLTRVKAMAQTIVDDAGAYGVKSVPALARRVIAADDVTTFADLRRLRTALGDEARSLEKSVNLGGSAEKLRNVSRLRDAVDETIDALGESGVPAAQQLRAANAAFREHQQLYSRAHPTVKKLLENEDPGDAIMSILGRTTKRPAEEARRLVAGLGDDADALEGLRRLTADELVWRASGKASKAGGPVSPSSVSGIGLGASLTQSEPALRVIMGDEQFDLLRRLAARIDTTTYGRAGTPGFYMSTGSALKSAEQQGAAGAEAAAETLGAIMNPMGKARQAMAKKAHEWLLDKTTMAQQRQLLEDAMVDPKIARDLLLDVTPERFAAWQERMRAHVARSGARAGATQPGSRE